VGTIEVKPLSVTSREEFFSSVFFGRKAVTESITIGVTVANVELVRITQIGGAVGVFGEGPEASLGFQNPVPTQVELVVAFP
jgi:hypothetical protein